MQTTSFTSSRCASTVTQPHSDAEEVGKTRGGDRGKRTPRANSVARCEVLESALANALPQDSGPVVIRLSSTDVYANLALEEWCVDDFFERPVFCTVYFSFKIARV